MTDLPNIDGLLQHGTELHSGVLLLLSETSEEAVKAGITERKRHRMDLRRAKAGIATAISELQKLKRDVENMEGDVTIDIQELDDLKWELIRGAKDSQSGHSTEP